MHTFKSHATCFTAISCYLHVLTETSMFENKTKKTWSVKKSYYNSKYHSAVVRSSNCSLSSAVQNQILMLTFKKKKQTFKIVLLSEYYNCSKARLTKWSSVAEWLECWTPLVFDHHTNEAQFIRLPRRRSRWLLPLCLGEDWWRTSAPPVFNPEFLCSRG